MLNELNAELSIVKMRITRGTISLDQACPLLAFATTEIPGEVRAKYFRDQGISTVQADVHVEATGDSFLRLHAIVRVKLTCKGDMVRSSELTRQELDERLHNLAQERCAQLAYKEIMEVAQRENT
jgi:hypothetical protein